MKGTKIFVIILILLILIAAGLLVLKMFNNNKVQEANTNSANEEVEEEPIIIQEPKTLSGDSRPIAVMIDNNINAMPQAGLLEADIIYEIIVEGGESRLMLILQDKDLDKIGPIRSARHYFLDYALENDAIYVHYGWSPQAQADITSLGVDNINGIYESSENFWRVTDKYAPHNAVTSTDSILEIANRKGYRIKKDKENVLNYVVDEVELEDGEIANTVTIPYSAGNIVEYEYDEDLKEYVRYSRGEKQVDWDTGKTVTTKNIIIEKLPKIYSKELIDYLFYDFYTKNEYVRDNLNISRNTASKYLHSLSEIGILMEEKVGKEIIYKNSYLYDLIKTW